MIHIAVTGTRLVLQPHQKAWLAIELEMLDVFCNLGLQQKPILHHGDCVGADAFAHGLARDLGWSIIMHPPIKQQFRAFCEGASKTLKPKKYLARDDDIAQRCSIILGVPGTPLGVNITTKGTAKLMSGTWRTLGLGLEYGKEVRICPILEHQGFKEWTERRK